MEKEFNAIKDFILNVLPDYAKEAETEDTPMPTIAPKSIVFGAVDVTKSNAKVLVSVLPEEQTETDAQYIGTRRYDSDFTVTFIFSGNKYDVLVRQMARYASAFREAILKNKELKEDIRLSNLGKRKFYPDVGTVENQMTALEVNMTITTEENLHKKNK